jgi:hypothetical protein
MERLVVWNPASPGMKVVVARSWWQQLIYPKDFATLTETLRYIFITRK